MSYQIFNDQIKGGRENRCKSWFLMYVNFLWCKNFHRGWFQANVTSLNTELEGHVHNCFWGSDRASSRTSLYQSEDKEMVHLTSYLQAVRWSNEVASLI